MPNGVGSYSCIHHTVEALDTQALRDFQFPPPFLSEELLYMIVERRWALVRPLHAFSSALWTDFSLSESSCFIE